MKNILKIAAAVLSAGLVSCHGIGSGSTVQYLKIIYYPVSGDQGSYLTSTNTNGAVTTDTLQMYDCFCSSVKVYAYFTNGTIGDFTTRVALTSSDPTVVQIARFDTTQPCAFTQNDPLLWTLVPKAVSANGPVTITANYFGLTATLQVKVANTASALSGTLALKPSDPNVTSPQVAVGSAIQLLLTGTLNGTQRTFNNNVVNSWTLTSPTGDDCTVPRSDGSAIPNGCKAVVSKAALAGGFVSGISSTGSTPANVQASFPACSTIPTQTAQVQVGDISGMTIAEEDGFYPTPPGATSPATDHKLATNSNEVLKVIAQLNFGSGAPSPGTGKQLISSSTSLTYTDNCTTVGPDSAGTGACATQTNQTCTGNTPVCTTPPASCAAGTTPCRTAAAPVVPSLFNVIVANADSFTNTGSAGNPTNFTAHFPYSTGTQTTLTGAIDNNPNTTTLIVTALTSYPTTFPWFGTITDQITGGNREDVRVVAASGTTLTVVRGQGGTSAVAHNAGDFFNQRSYASVTPLPVTGKDGTLRTTSKSLAIWNQASTSQLSMQTLTSSSTPAITTLGTANGTLQLQAIGTYIDSTSTSRQQSVTHLTSANSGPYVTWSSSDTTVATVGPNSGLVSSSSICGGAAVIRARASTSIDPVDSSFQAPVAFGDPTTDQDRNNNVDTNDLACKNDPLCDQVNLCIVTPSALPLGTVCTKTTTYNTSTGACTVQ